MKWLKLITLQQNEKVIFDPNVSADSVIGWTVSCSNFRTTFKCKVESTTPFDDVRISKIDTKTGNTHCVTINVHEAVRRINKSPILQGGKFGNLICPCDHRALIGMQFDFKGKVTYTGFVKSKISYGKYEILFENGLQEVWSNKKIKNNEIN